MADLAENPVRNLAPYWEFAWAHLGHPDLRQNAQVAAKAGLGEIGAHGMLLTPEYGPRQRFSFLLTTAELPEGTDTKALLEKASANGVAFVPGYTFMLDMDKPSNVLRLNYSLVPEDKIETAIKLLAEVM